MNAWKAEYKGNAKETFISSLIEWNGERRRLLAGDAMQTEGSVEAAYINVVTIVQSSGTGKSRLLYETAADIFTIPLNLRNSRGEHIFI